MVVIKDPAAIENYWEQSRYPVQDTLFSANFAWLLKNRAETPVTFPFEQVSLCRGQNLCLSWVFLVQENVGKHSE